MEEIQLKDICDLDNGYAFKSDNYIEESNTLNCRMSNIRPDGSFDILYSAKYLPDEFAEKYKDYILRDGDLIIAMTDMAGDPKILGVPTVVNTQGYNLLLNQRVGKLRFIKGGVNADYLKLALQCKKVREYLKRFAGGGVQLNVSKKDILSAPVRMRSKEEQDHIVELFSRVLKIKKQRENELQLLDDLIKARFVELFGDLRTNTKGWEIKMFDELSYLITDGEHATPRRSTEGIYLLSARNVLNHSLQLDDVDYIDQEEYDRIAKRVVPQEGDVLISCSGTVGRCCSVPADFKFQMVRSAALIRFKEEINPIFAEYMITSDYLQEQINSSKTASSQANLFQGKIKALKGFVPPIELQNEFLMFVKQVDKSKFIDIHAA